MWVKYTYTHNEKIFSHFNTYELCLVRFQSPCIFFLFFPFLMYFNWRLITLCIIFDENVHFKNVHEKFPLNLKYFIFNKTHINIIVIVLKTEILGLRVKLFQFFTK